MKIKLDEQYMTWKLVLLLSLISAAIVAALNCIPIFEDTSFTAPAETTELWLVLALFLVWGCKGYIDSMLKTFVFFLISQPLIYLLEVPFKADGWSLFRYYPFWGMMTILTIPAAILAYRVKKDDILAAIILSIANFDLIFQGFARIGSVLYEFPSHLLTFVFCVGMPFVLIFLLLKKWKSRIVALVLAVLILFGGVYYYVIDPTDSSTGYPLPEDNGNWTVTSVSSSAIEVEAEGDSLSVSSHKNGTYYIELEAEDGTTIRYKVVVEGADHLINIYEVEE